MKRIRNDSCAQRSSVRLSTPLRLSAAAVAACFITGQAVANPTAPTVVNGAASFNQAGNVLTVTNSNGAVINWNTFSIAAGETTHFAQTSASSQVLNRVLANDPSLIYGTLSSNGRVWLVNPAGIMVGPSGRIDVAGFVASTLNISNADFLAGRLNFNATPGAGNVVNQGEITTPAGGNVYLIGANVTNEGIITTPQGETILAAGQTVSLIDTATPGVKVDITGAEGNVTNLGAIVADAGRIGIAGVIVRNSGELNASSAVSEGGRIFLKASQDAYVDGDGRIITTGTKGGSVEVLGNRVAVTDNAEIDASGQNGGGTILVGGDYQGKNPAIQNASVTYFGPNASLKADAQELGAGGTVIVWADDTTRAYGTISARGGANGGNGGFVETSGHRYLAVDGIHVDTRAPQGTTGNWLLDPDELTILNGSGTDIDIYGGPIFSTISASSTIYGAGIETALGATNVTLQTSAYGGGNGNITASGVTINNGTAAYGLTLAAYGSGGATGNINITNSNFYVYGGMTLLAGWDGAGFTSADVIGGTGDITISGSQMQSWGGAIELWAGHDIKLSYGGSVGTGVQGATMDVFAGHDLALIGGSSVSGTYGPSVVLQSWDTQTVYASNAITLTAGSANNTYGGVSFYGGSVAIQANGDQTVSAATIELVAGTAGHDNTAIIEGGGSMQTINVTTLLDVKGGGGGIDNYAHIHATGAYGSQIINAAGAAIILTGGASGGALDHENGANINLGSSNTGGSQTVYADSITTYGGAATYGGAGFGSENGNDQSFYVTGDLTMNGGSSSNSDFRATPVWIGSEYGGGMITVNVDVNILLNGGSGTAGGVLIGALYDDTCGGFECPTTTNVMLSAGRSIIATGNTGGVWLGVKNLTGSSLNGVTLNAGSIDNSPSFYGGNIAMTGPGGIQTDSSGTVEMVAYRSSSEAYGGISLGSGTIIYGGGIGLSADGTVNLNGRVEAVNFLQVYAGLDNSSGPGDPYYNSFYGGNIALGASSQIYGGDVELIANRGTDDATTGNITQLAGGHLHSTVWDSLYAYAAGNIELLGTTVVDNSAPVNISAGDSCADGCNDIQDKHITISSLDAFGSSVNLYATSHISANTQDVSSIQANINNNINGGGIVINNTGAAQPYSVSLSDNSTGLYSDGTAHSSVTFIHTGSDLTLDYNYYFSTNNGSILVAAPSNNLTYTSGEGGLYGASVILAAGNNLDINNSLYTPGDLSLGAGNTLNINSSVYSDNAVVLAAPTINVGNGADATGYSGLGFFAGSLNMTANSCLHTSGNIVGEVSGDITLDDNSFMEAGDDIALTLRGANSTLSLANGSYLLADAVTMIQATIFVDFTARSSGGIFINGTETTRNDGSTGFFVVDASTPAMLDSGLLVTYTRPANEQVLAILDSNLDRSTSGLDNEDETEEERARRLRDANETQDGENNGQADKPVAQCS